jgi:alpha-1,2-mannosyltransferase
LAAGSGPSVTRSRLLTGPAAVLLLVVAAAVWAGARGDFTDLFVYQHAGDRMLDGLSVYGSRDPVMDLPFTYPPFAAVAMVPLAVLPTWLAASVLAGASVGALAAAVVVVRRALDRPAPGWLVALAVAAAVALEPVWQNLTFGQLNVFLMLAVLVDLVGHRAGEERRWSGVLVGVAAGLKLTPLVFVVLLVLVGRRTAAGRALLAFAVTVAVGFAAMPAQAGEYWTDGLVDGSRVGPPALAHNQSVYGALARLLGHEPSTLLWMAVAGPLALAVVVVAARWWRRGDRVLGTCLGAVAMLLASPISWSHHWVWAVPVALVLWERSRWAASAWTGVFVARPIIWPPYAEGRELDWSPLEHLVGNAYVLAALALACWAAVALAARGRPAVARSFGDQQTR